MKNLHELDEYRVPHMGFMGDENNGKFVIPDQAHRFNYLVIASKSDGWEHVSVSLISLDRQSAISRCPKWGEMCFIKNKFFDPEEIVMQLHPAESKYVNFHNYVLHLWKPIDQEIPTPPIYMV